MTHPVEVTQEQAMQEREGRGPGRPVRGCGSRTAEGSGDLLGPQVFGGRQKGKQDTEGSHKFSTDWGS